MAIAISFGKINFQLMTDCQCKFKFMLCSPRIGCITQVNILITTHHYF